MTLSTLINSRLYRNIFKTIAYLISVVSLLSMNLRVCTLKLDGLLLSKYILRQNSNEETMQIV